MLLYQSPKLYMDCSVQCRVQATQIRGLLGKGKQMALTVTAQVWALGMLQQCHSLKNTPTPSLGCYIHNWSKILKSTILYLLTHMLGVG